MVEVLSPLDVLEHLPLGVLGHPKPFPTSFTGAPKTFPH